MPQGRGLLTPLQRTFLALFAGLPDQDQFYLIRFEPPVRSEYGVFVNPYLDLSIDKLLAYYGRAEPRDAIDLYFILQQDPMLSLAERAATKDPGFDLYWMAVALDRAESFPDELDRWPVQMLVPCDPQQIKRTFRELAIEPMSRATRQ